MTFVIPFDIHAIRYIATHAEAGEPIEACDLFELEGRKFAGSVTRLDLDDEELAIFAST
jgi:predicted RNA-binding protein